MTQKANLFNMIATLGIICGLSALSLGYVYNVTKKPIQRTKDNRELEAVSKVIPSRFNNNPFIEKVALRSNNGAEDIYLYPARLDSEITGFAIKSYTDKGFSGRMELIIGFFLDGTVNTYMVTDHKETPGLGTKVLEDKFVKQFYGMHPKNPSFKVRQSGGEIDAVTAATISSKAVIDAIKKASDSYSKFSTGE